MNDARGAYAPDLRYALCDQCGAPVPVPSSGGRVACNHCRAPLELRMRIAAAVVPPRHPEPQRLMMLRAQDPRFTLPPTLAPLFAAERIAPAREQEAWARWRVLRAAPGQEEDLCLLTLGLAEALLARGELLVQRGLIESALAILTRPRHRQLLAAVLARSACRAGDFGAAEAWIAFCDPSSEDLLADTAYRLARATLDTAAGRTAAVVHVLGVSAGAVPISHAYAAECAALRAHALERHGDVGLAVGELLELERELGPLAGRRARRFLAAHASWGLCAQAAPRAEALSRALEPQIFDPSPALTILTVMTIYCLVWTLAGAVGVGLGLAALWSGGLGGHLLSVLSGICFAAIFLPLTLRAWRKVRQRRALQRQGRPETAHVLASRARPDPLFADEGVLEVELDLLVTPDDTPAYHARATLPVVQEALAPYGAGATVVVRVDPQSPGRVAVELR